MAEKRVSVRLVAEGGGAFRAELDGLGAAGDRAFSRAEQSAEVFGREMDRLRQKFDPLYANSQNYERQVEELNRAQTMGITIAGGYEAALERLNAEYARVALSSQTSMGQLAQTNAEMERLRQKFDPLYASSQRYAQQVEELNRAQTMGITIAGGYEAALERLNAEYARVALSSQTSMGQLAQTNAEMERLRQKFDPLYASSQRYAQQVEELNRAQTMGVTVVGGYEAALERLNAEYARVALSSQTSMGQLAQTNAEMERLRQKFDPLYASSQRYAQQVEELNRAQTMGVTVVGGYEAALERLNAEYARNAMATQAAVGQLGLMTRTAPGFGAAFARSAPMIQQASFQVQDFAVQVAMGTDVSRAFAQQAPQLLSAIGPMGSRFAAIGSLIGVAIAIGVPLAAMFFNTGEEAKTLDERLEDLESAIDSYVDSSRTARQSTQELEERFGSATGEARAFLEALVEIDRITALEGLQSTLRGIATQFGSFEGSTLNRAIDPIDETLTRIRAQLLLAQPDAERLAAALQNLQTAATPAAAVAETRALLDLLEQILGPFEGMSTEARALYTNIRTAGENAAELKGAAEGAGGALAGAAGQAQRIADALARAVDSAADLASASVTDLQRAQIEYDFRDDPVARAAALARAEFDARTAAADGADPTITVVVEQQRRAFVANAVAVAELSERTREWRALQRDAARSGAAGTRAEQQFAREMAEQIEAAELQLSLVGRTSAEIAALTGRQELLNDARRRGLDLDRVMSSNGETLIEQIERQSAALADLALHTEQATERSRFFTDIQSDLKNGLLDSLVEGENFIDTLDDVGRALRRAALQALLFGEGPLASLFGGGGKGGGGVLSALFAAVFHGGGDVGGTALTRSVSPALFLGAPRLHDGADLGLRAGEVPAILERGERVQSRAEVARGAGGLAGRIEIALGPDLEARILEAAGQQSVTITKHAMKAVPRMVKSGINQHQANPRRTA